MVHARLLPDGPRTEQYTEGTLIIDFLDRRTNNLVWRGSMADPVDDPARLGREFSASAKDILDKFPVAEKSSRALPPVCGAPLAPWAGGALGVSAPPEMGLLCSLSPPRACLPPHPGRTPCLTYLRIKNYRALRDVEFRDLTPLDGAHRAEWQREKHGAGCAGFSGGGGAG
ncbi:MAG: DUF4136 domain-containing protein [Hymenobacter sp.]